MSQLVVGLIGCSQPSFPGPKKESYQRSGELLQEFCTARGHKLVMCPQLVETPEEAEIAANQMTAAKADFVLIQATSFHRGDLVPILSRTNQFRIGLWAIPESTNEGPVPFNSFCSLNMDASILGHYYRHRNIKLKWFHGQVADSLMGERLEITLSALSGLKKLERARIGLIGGIAPGFNDLYFDERKIMEILPGIYLNRLHEFDEIKNHMSHIPGRAIKAASSEFRTGASGIHTASEELMDINAGIYLALKEIAREESYDAIALSCWPRFQTDYRMSACATVGRLNDDGLVVSCEGDIPSAMAMLLLQEISGSRSMLMDLSDFDETDESLLLWHCGPAASCFASESGFSLGVNYHGLPHGEDGCLNCCGIVRDMVFKPGPVSISRFTPDFDGLLISGGTLVGPQKAGFSGSRGWMGDVTWNGERIQVRDFINSILVHRFPHHYPVVSGRYEDVLMEIAAWLGIQPLEKIPYQKHLQTRR